MGRSSKRNIIYIFSIIILFTLLISGTGAEEASDSTTLIGIDGDSSGHALISDVSETAEDDTISQSSDAQSLDLEKQRVDALPIANNWPGTMLLCIIFLCVLLSMKIVISKRYPDLNMDIRAIRSSPKKLIRLRPVYVVKKVRVIIPEDKFDNMQVASSKPDIGAEADKNATTVAHIETMTEATLADIPVDSRPRSDMRFICINGRIRDRSPANTPT